MELRINCDASVKLKKINGTRNVNCNVIDYKIKNDTLNGNIMINGIYLKDELEKEFEFSELVPFTVVFRDENFEVTDIRVENFNNNDIVNQSVDCHFDIVISYEERKPKKEEVIEAEVVEDEDEELEKIVDEIEDEIEEEIEEDVDENVNLEDDEKISNKYDKMLEDILTRRNDNFLDEYEEEYSEEIPIEELVEPKPEKNNIAVNLTKGIEEKQDPIFKTMNESYQCYSIYFINNDSDIDKICKNENLNINDVYEDYSKNRRIIVK